MYTNFSILMVDDDRGFLDQGSIYLQEMIDQLEVKTSINVEEALQRLENEEFDVIISDYQMPETDGLEFLEILRKKRNSDIPFIMFTGKGREEVAMEALNLEANRYLQKGGDPRSQYGLLAETVKQEIERKKSEKEISRLSSIVRNSSEAIICTDKDLRITFVNESAENMFGYEKEQLEDKKISTLNAENNKKDIYNKIYDEITSEKTYKNIHLNERKDGSIFYCEMKISPIKDDEGNINGYVSSQRDITDRKKAEERVGHLNSLLRAIRNVNQIIVQGESLENIMQNACDFFVGARSYLECTIGLLDDKSKLIKPIAMSDLHKLGRDWSLNLEGDGDAPPCIKKVVKDGKIEIRNTKDCSDCDFKEEREYHTSLTVPMKRHDSIVGIIHIGFNEFVEVDEEEITLIEEVADDLAFARDKLLSERDLEETKDRLELALDASDHGFWDWNLDTDEVYFNPKFYDMLGYEEEELPNLYDTWKELMHPDDKNQMISEILGYIENAEPFEKEFRLKTKSGKWKWISARGKSYELDEDGTSHRAVGTHVDIDERKRKEEVIKESQKRYKSIFEESPNALWEEDYSEVKEIVDKKKEEVDDLDQYLDENPEFIKKCIENVRIIDFNKKVLEMYDADDREEYLDNLDKVLTEKSLEIFKKTLVKIANGETYIEGEDINKTLSGDKIDVFVTWKVVPGYDEDYSRVYVSDTDITERKEAERKVKRSEEKFRTFTEKAPVPVFIHQDEKCIYANAAAEDLLGYSKENILGKDIWTFIHPKSEEKVKERRDRRKNGEDVEPIEDFKIISKDGEKFVRMMVEPIKHEGEKVYAVVAIDKTEEKKYQEEIEYQADLLDKVGQAVIVTDINGNIEFWNQRAEELYGWDSEEVIGKNIMDVTPSLHSKEHAEEIMKKLKKGETWKGEFFVKDKDGNEFPALVSDKPIMDQEGKIKSIVGITTNISKLKEKERELREQIQKRKELEEKLRENKERYQSLFNHSPDGILLIDKEGDIVEFNDRAYEQLNYSKEEFSNINISDIEADESKEEVHEHIEKIRSEGFDSFETLHETKDGTIKNTKVIAQIIDVGGEEYIHTIFRDITERKETFKRLKKSKRFLQKSIDSIPANICILDEEGEIIKVNKRWKEFADSEELGWSNYGIGHNYLNISKESEGMGSEGSDKVYNGIKSVIHGEQNLFKHECPCHSPDERRWFLLTASSFEISGETRVIISHTNITERKIAENRLKENRSRLKRSQEIASVGSWELLLDTNKLKWSEQTYDIFGIDKEEPIDYDQFLKIIHPEDREYVDIKWHEALETGEYDIKHRIVVDGKTKWVREKADIRFEDKGKPVEVVGSVQDITEQKKTRDKLRKNKNELETILESVPAMIWYKDTENNFIRVNRAAAEVTGYSPEEMEGKSVKEFYPEKAGEYFEDDLEVIESGKPKLGIIEEMETRYDGTKWVITDKVPYRDEEGNVIGVIVLSIDITKRKEYEEELIRSKEEYKNLIDSMNDAVFIHDLQGNFLTVNQEAVNRLEYSEEELLSMSPREIDVPEYEGKVKERIEKVKEGENLVFESKHITKKNEEIPVEINSSLINYRDETAILSVVRDITERKKSENKLRKSERKFRKTFEALPDPTFLLDKNGFLKDANKAVQEILGFDKDDIIGQNISKAPFISEKAIDKKIEKFEKRKKGDDISPYVLELKDNEDNSLLAEINAGIFEEDGFEGELLIARDITEKKKAKEREKMLYSLLRHDVKNKILVAQGYIDLIKDYDLDETVENYLERTDRTINKSIDIISKVRDLQKVQDEDIQEIDLISELSEAISDSKSSIIKNDIEIKSNFKLDQCNVKGGKSLSELFYNIIENMINHSKGNKIRISLKENENEVICSLEDNGIGISDTEKGMIFEKGYTTDEERGTGLGLFLVKRLIDSYGGKVEVKDSSMGGAGFDIYLKRA